MTDSITITREQLEQFFAKWLAYELPRHLQCEELTVTLSIKTRAILEQSLTTALFNSARTQEEHVAVDGAWCTHPTDPGDAIEAAMQRTQLQQDAEADRRERL